MAWYDAIGRIFKGREDPVQRRSPSSGGGPNGEPSAAGRLVRDLAEQLRLETTRRACYGDYEQMDAEAPEARRALDAFVDNAMQPGPSGDVVELEFRATGVREVFAAVERDTHLMERAWGTMRATRRYGDHFKELIFDRDGRLRRLKDLPPREIRRVCDQYGVPDPDPWRQHGSDGEGGEVARFREWQVVHWAEVPAGETYGYTRSQLAGARKPWRAVEMAQSALLAERVLHTGTRLAFHVNVSGLSTDEAIDYLRAVKREYARSTTHSSSTGARSDAFRPLTALDDLWLPWAADGPKNPVEAIRMGAEIGEVADIKFHYGRFLTSLEVPRYMLGLDEDIRSRAATGYIDAAFIRSVIRSQHVYLSGASKVYNRALFAAGYEGALTGDPRDLYRASFPQLQLAAEKLRWEVIKLRADVAKVYGLDLAVVGPEFVLRYFLGLDDELVAAARKGLPPEVAPRSRQAKAAETDLPPLPPDARLDELLGSTSAGAVRALVAASIDALSRPPSTDDEPVLGA